MTLPEFLVVLVVVFMIFRPVPKLGKKPRAQRKPLPRRGPFRVKDNPLKQYKGPGPNMRAVAFARRAEHLKYVPETQLIFNEILRSMGFVEGSDYEQESIAFYPGSFCLFDFYFFKQRLIVEIDGSAHDDKGQANHDRGRDEYFARQGMRTVRIRNRVVLTQPNVCRELMKVELGL